MSRSIRASRGFVSMEALALISVLCIAGIFIFAHYARQTSALDDLARVTAREIGPKIAAYFQAEPQGRLTPEVIKTAGAEPAAPLLAQITPLKDRAEDWQVMLWHPEGNKRFVLSPTGLAEEYR